MDKGQQEIDGGSMYVMIGVEGENKKVIRKKVNVRNELFV